MNSIDPAEKKRLYQMMHLERDAYQEGYSLIAGLDEAGRGPLAGPVVAAACLLPPGYLVPGVNDSKLLTPKQRYLIYQTLISDPAVVIGVGEVSSEEIDRINILEATKQAMRFAVANLSCSPDLLFIDAIDLPFSTIPSRAFIRGDSRSQSIAAASVIAKVVRDQKMENYDGQWPEYGFRQHKGYGTKAHLKAIALHGPCPIHRFSFEPIKTSRPWKNF